MSCITTDTTCSTLMYKRYIHLLKVSKRERITSDTRVRQRDTERMQCRDALSVLARGVVNCRVPVLRVRNHLNKLIYCVYHELHFLYDFSSLATRSRGGDHLCAELSGKTWACQTAPLLTQASPQWVEDVTPSPTSSPSVTMIAWTQEHVVSSALPSMSGTPVAHHLCCITKRNLTHVYFKSQVGTEKRFHIPTPNIKG